MASISYFELFNLLRTHGKNLKDYESLLEMVLANVTEYAPLAW